MNSEAVDLEGPIHAGRSDEMGVTSESDGSGQSRVIVERLQLLPLLAEINPEMTSHD